jgi:hypothetical protein
MSKLCRRSVETYGSWRSTAGGRARSPGVVLWGDAALGVSSLRRAVTAGSSPKRRAGLLQALGGLWLKPTRAIALLLALLAPSCSPSASEGEGKAKARPAEREGWQTLETGLDLGRFPSPQPSRSGDSVVSVLRIDPRRFKLTLENASAEKDGQPRTARQWCRHRGLTAAINASMYGQDLKTSVSLMRTAGHVNNPGLSKDMTLLAFEPVRPGLPPVKIVDRQCDALETWKTRYATLVQSIRMVSCKGENTWQQQSRQGSIAAIGLDRRGRVLFLHARSPWSTHDFIDILRQLPLELAQAQYAEGGPEAQLFVRHGGREVELIGNFEAASRESDGNRTAWPVPNVIGVKKRDRPPA